ncbi:MAG TPA: HoxN/HupN/NixA family nickel/cobalt transporter [Ktedonobacteraceae bacterium]|nr:HoxN/HupN/NixA family nickel/cobalt transporter [Ktedonobacteraceae bacterium]
MKSAFGIKALRRVFDDSASDVRRKVISIYVVLIVFNVLIWAAVLLGFTPYPALYGTAVLAYTFGLRHAVDADHISAIDNVTRKLMQENRRPVAVGFFFGLGHSTIVVLLGAVIAIAASLLKVDLQLESVAGAVGTGASAFFLYLIAFLNAIVLVDIFRAFRKIRRGEGYSEQTLNEVLNQRGFLARFFRPLFKITTRSWHMYPIGILFGLGFETATEVAILAISATTVSKGLPAYLSLLFPLLFTAGMTLIDATDSILMLGAYGWAFVKPVRKLYYNLNITLISVFIAFVIGTIEVLSIVADQLQLHGWLWDTVGDLDFGTIGFLIIGLFIGCWVISTIIYKVRRYDQLGEQEVKTLPDTITV